LAQGIALCRRLNTELCRIAPYEQFRFIVSSNLDGCVVRFHKIRPREIWLVDDLEEYEEDAVMLLDSGDAELLRQQ
jgi:hypothetical protein